MSIRNILLAGAGSKYTIDRSKWALAITDPEALGFFPNLTFRSIAVGSAGSIFVLGKNTTPTESSDVDAIRIIKVDPVGEIFWSKQCKTLFEPIKISVSADELFVYVSGIIGFNRSMVMCLDSMTGSIMWQYEFEGFISSIIVDVNESIYVSVNSSMYLQQDSSAKLVKLFPNGKVQWCKFLSNTRHITDIVLDYSGNLAVSGIVDDRSSAVIKVTKSGEINWLRKVIGTDGPHSLAVDYKNNVFLFSCNPFYSIIKFSDTGVLLRDVDFGFPGSLTSPSICISGETVLMSFTADSRNPLIVTLSLDLELLVSIAPRGYLITDSASDLSENYYFICNSDSQHTTSLISKLNLKETIVEIASRELTFPVYFNQAPAITDTQPLRVEEAAATSISCLITANLTTYSLSNVFPETELVKITY